MGSPLAVALLIVVESLVAKHGLWGAWASAVVAMGALVVVLGSRAQAQ